MDINQKVNGLQYPINYLYDAETMVPGKYLQQRLDIILKVFPKLFDVEGKRCLDIGANKGYISAKWMLNGGDVTSIEPLTEGVEVMNSVKEHHGLEYWKIINGTLQDLMVFEPFDYIFLGNVHHYLYEEYGGYFFLHRLAMLCRDTLIIEGPTDVYCQSKAQTETMLDKSKNWPEWMRQGFNKESLEETLRLFFDIVTCVPSYDVDRYVYICKRFPFPEIPFDRIKDNLTTLGLQQNDKNIKQLVMYKNNIVRTFKLHEDQPIIINPYRLNVINRCFYFTAPTTGMVVKDNKPVSYLRLFIDGPISKPVREHVALVLKLNTYLLKMHMLWIDVARNNMIVDIRRRPFLIDFEDIFVLPAVRKNTPEYYKVITNFYHKTLSDLFKSVDMPPFDYTPEELCTLEAHYELQEKYGDIGVDLWN